MALSPPGRGLLFASLTECVLSKIGLWMPFAKGKIALEGPMLETIVRKEVIPIALNAIGPSG